MDLWSMAATAATGFINNHLQNASKGKENFLESSSEDLNNLKVESPRCLTGKLVREAKKSNEENFRDCLNGENLDVFECDNNVHGVEVASSNGEISLDSFGNRAFLRRNRRYTSLIKPLRREKMSMEEYMRSPFPSPCGSVSRPFLVTDGAKVISKNTGDYTSKGQRVPDCGIPQLRKLESSVLYAKRRTGI